MVVGVCFALDDAGGRLHRAQAGRVRGAARVQVDLENNPALGASAKGGPVILNTPRTTPSTSHAAPILSGPGLLRRVVKTLDLEHNQAFLQPQAAQKRSTWPRLLSMFGLGAARRRDDRERQR